MRVRHYYSETELGGLKDGAEADRYEGENESGKVSSTALTADAGD